MGEAASVTTGRFRGKATSIAVVDGTMTERRSGAGRGAYARVRQVGRRRGQSQLSRWGREIGDDTIGEAEPEGKVIESPCAWRRVTTWSIKTVLSPPFGLNPTNASVCVPAVATVIELAFWVVYVVAVGVNLPTSSPSSSTLIVWPLAW